MSSHIIQAKTFKFIRDLQKHNDRDWFQANKPRYEIAHANMVAFSEALMDGMLDQDNVVPMTGKKMLFRIYRDVRFSKNKAPYKNHFSGRMRRNTELLRGGYYYHIMPEGGSFIAGGFWGPEKDDLRRIRDELAMDAQPLRDIIAQKKFVDTFGELIGDALKTAPKGFDKAHPDIDLIRMKQYIVKKSFSDEEVLADDFVENLLDAYAAMLPFFNYMSEVLTTDTNGRRIV
ncbi:MAG: DUF2461 domain-containing protein [Bacteroidota bacterium]